MKLDRIVVGIDGSRNSDRAADVAATLAELSGAQVLAVHAVGLLEDLGQDGETSAERRAAIRQQLETGWTDVLRRGDISVSVELRDGSPVDALLGAIADIDADLVVVGSRGIGIVPTQLLGSTSAQLAIATPCPIVVVPDHDDAGED